MNNTVNISFGANSMNSDRFIGWSISNLRDDEFVQDHLGLSGSESFTLNGANAGESTILQAGDNLVFQRDAGRKG